MHIVPWMQAKRHILHCLVPHVYARAPMQHVYCRHAMHSACMLASASVHRPTEAVVAPHQSQLGAASDTGSGTYRMEGPAW